MNINENENGRGEHVDERIEKGLRDQKETEQHQVLERDKGHSQVLHYGDMETTKVKVTMLMRRRTTNATRVPHLVNCITLCCY